MHNNVRLIKLVLTCSIVLLALWGGTRAGATTQQPRPMDEPKTNTPTDNLIIYIPALYRDYSSCTSETVESPFSIEIAALHQITTTVSDSLSSNLVSPKISEEQYRAWYNLVFPTLVSALDESGAGWTRIVIRWSDIEPNEPVSGQPPSYDLDWLQWYDSRLLQIAQAGVKMIAVINSAPAWANNSTVCPPVTPDHGQEFQRFLTDIVARYSQSPYNIKHWEIFNEADNTTVARAESHGCWGTYGQEYRDILSISYPAIKSTDPNATVLMSGLAYEWWTEAPYNGPFDRYFPDDVMSYGGANYFDALNFHYFPDYHLEWERWNPPAQPPTCGLVEDGQGTPYNGSGIDIIAKKNHYTNRMGTCFSVNKPVWLTETAEHGVVTDAASLRKQAYYVIQGYTRGLAAGIQNITWYALATPNDTFDQGLLFTDLTPKPAFLTYKTLVTQLTNFKYTRTINVPGGEAYVFQNNCKGEKIVAWGNNAPLTLSPATSLNVVDYLGNVSTIQDGGVGDMDGTRNGSIQITLVLDPMGSVKVPLPAPIPIFISVFH